jgi:hypothetical protein
MDAAATAAAITETVWQSLLGVDLRSALDSEDSLVKNMDWPITELARAIKHRGTPGSYTYDFTVSNNALFPADVFIVDVIIASATGTNSPAGWNIFEQNSSQVDWSWDPTTPPGATIQQNNSLSGFELTEPSLLTSLTFFVILLSGRRVRGSLLN